MIVKAKLLDVEMRSYNKDGQSKQVADLVFKSGSDTMTVTMFDGDISRSKHTVYEQNVGKYMIVEIRCDVFRGNIQYQLGFKDPVISADKPVKQAA